jgi:hypothetical protein
MMTNAHLRLMVVVSMPVVPTLKGPTHANVTQVFRETAQCAQVRLTWQMRKNESLLFLSLVEWLHHSLYVLNHIHCFVRGPARMYTKVDHDEISVIRGDKSIT